MDEEARQVLTRCGLRKRGTTHAPLLSSSGKAAHCSTSCTDKAEGRYLYDSKVYPYGTAYICRVRKQVLYRIRCTAPLRCQITQNTFVRMTCTRERLRIYSRRRHIRRRRPEMTVFRVQFQGFSARIRIKNISHNQYRPEIPFSGTFIPKKAVYYFIAFVKRNAEYNFIICRVVKKCNDWQQGIQKNRERSLK